MVYKRYEKIGAGIDPLIFHTENPKPSFNL